MAAPPRHGATTVGALCCLLLVAGTATVLLASPAYAHVRLVSSTPRDGAAVSKAPDEVLLRFSEAVRAPAYVVVSGPGGSRLDDGPAQVVDNTVTEQLAPITEPGEYSVAYRVVSVDGHPVTGELSFTLTGDGAATSAAPPDDTSSGPPRAQAGAEHAHPTGAGAHWGSVLPLLGVVGAGVVVLLNDRRRRRAEAAQGASSPPT